ncbi:MAG: glycoside hydrolase family protein [Caulobacter sp.]|nr:glycoside hydrolase family protein [Caulobacter sp.]
MKPRHQVSKAAVELIKRFEGYRSKAAQLPDGRWTIGYGHTLTAREGAQVSEQDAEALLLYDLIAVAFAVNEQTYTPLTQNQFDALCCFAFNVGLENFKRSSVLRRINEGSMLQAACAMEMWRKADFEGERIVVDALVRRRSAEKTLFLTPAGGWVPAPSPIVRPKVDYDAANAVPRQVPTALKTSLTGDRAFAERDPSTPAPVVAPAEGALTASPVPLAPVTAAMTAAAAVTSMLARIEPDPVPVSFVADSAPATLEAPVVDAAAPMDVSLTGTAENAVIAAPDDDGGDGYASADEPVLEIETQLQSVFTAVSHPEASPAPSESHPWRSTPQEFPSPAPYPAPAAMAMGGDRTFILTPLPDLESQAEPMPSPARAFEMPVAANESEPGLFDIPTEPYSEFSPVRRSERLSEEQVRRLVEADEREMASGFDPMVEEASLEPAKIAGLPWLASALGGVAVCAGGVVWGYNDQTGNILSTGLGWGLGISGAGLFLFSAWRWLDGLGMPRLDDEDGEPGQTRSLDFDPRDPA